MSDIDLFLLVIGIIGTVAYGVSGALTAIENKLDFFGVVILGVVTAVGGGLLRDVMMFHDLAIFSDWWYPLISAVTAGLVFLVMWFLRNLSWENSEVYKVTFMLIDALGLGAFCVVGALRAISYGITSGYQIVFYSVITCVGGGMLRDLMVCKIPVIFRKHIYAVAAIIGALYYYMLYYFHTNAWVSSLTTVALVMVIRILAFRFKWNFPRIHLKNENEVQQ